MCVVVTVTRQIEASEAAATCLQLRSAAPQLASHRTANYFSEVKSRIMCKARAAPTILFRTINVSFYLHDWIV